MKCTNTELDWLQILIHTFLLNRTKRFHNRVCLCDCNDCMFCKGEIKKI